MIGAFLWFFCWICREQICKDQLMDFLPPFTFHNQTKGSDALPFPSIICYFVFKLDIFTLTRNVDLHSCMTLCELIFVLCSPSGILDHYYLFLYYYIFASCIILMSYMKTFIWSLYVSQYLNLLSTSVYSTSPYIMRYNIHLFWCFLILIVFTFQVTSRLTSYAFASSSETTWLSNQLLWRKRFTSWVQPQYSCGFK